MPSKAHQPALMLGECAWLANATCPEICHVTSQLGRVMANPSEKHCQALLRLMAHVINHQDDVIFCRSNGSAQLKAHADSSWQDIPGDVGDDLDSNWDGCRSSCGMWSH